MLLLIPSNPTVMARQAASPGAAMVAAPVIQLPLRIPQLTQPPFPTAVPRPHMHSQRQLAPNLKSNPRMPRQAAYCATT
jgi:hypothetical protein